MSIEDNESHSRVLWIEQEFIIKIVRANAACTKSLHTTDNSVTDDRELLISIAKVARIKYQFLSTTDSCHTPH